MLNALRHSNVTSRMLIFETFQRKAGTLIE